MTDSQFRQNGMILDLVPTADVVGGQIIFRGPIAGQVTTSCAAGGFCGLRVEGVIRVAKASATVLDPAVGAEVHWDATNKLAVAAAADGKLGRAVAGGAAGDAYVDVKLNV